jgi:hypothetical protein
MEATFDGFCGGCRGKDENGTAVASACGHRTARSKACFCTPCALRMHVCQGCGIPIPLPQTTADRDD